VGTKIQLTASDGHQFGAYVASQSPKPSPGLVVLQEAFGVNRHIRSVADGYANDGFLAIAPALFDRIERDVEVGYEGTGREKGLTLARQINPNDAINDIAAALAYLRQQGQQKCGVIGYCLGGLLSWLSATRLDPDAAVGYYGGRIAEFANEMPRCPVMLHFGALDKHIPKPGVDQVQAKHPEVQIFWYEADHGFNCNDRAAYNEPAARQARTRSLDFLKKHLGM